MRDENVDAKAIFLQALDCAGADELQRFLEQACGDDAVLRTRVEELLRAHRDAGAFLGGADQPLAERAGSVIGCYKLVQEIGTGGMGAVWMAQQTEPVKRLVALKVIKPGMDSRQVIARFEAERQALALMDHPNIACVLDAGTTASGRPYFVMELVKGVPLTKYCDEHRLTPKERLELFIPVCQAIQHAHQKGIIHRDIKPSNVLVALYDGRPVPKVIDFGIAKATGQQLTERTLVTGFGAVIGTVEYMSPEQAELNQLDIDTRSDIYGLGVLLYELLTGSTPLERKQLKEAALLEVLRLIREEEPPRPSTRLSTTDELPVVAARRNLEPKKLSGLVRGELDWIVMKALEKDRNRRYETANGLAQDIQRYLADEPVRACPPSTRYRLRKLARRNKTALTVAALVLVLLAALAGTVGWAVRDRAAREQEQARDREARQAKAASDLKQALDRAELLQRDGKREEALAAFERVELLASQAPADPAQDARLAALRERLAAEARDQEFVARFEDIRLRLERQLDGAENRFNESAAFPEVREALGRYGIAIGVMAPAQAAAVVLARPASVRRDLIAALDHCLEHAPAGDVQSRQWLLATLAEADSDVWRVQVRQALARRDGKALEARAREADVDKQPPSFLLHVARSLPASLRAARLELLQRIQRAYPGDLWTNHALALELQDNGQAAEAIRYYTAALALRPDNPGIYLNRGAALTGARESDAAIADYRQALALAPQDAHAHHNLGLALSVKGQLDEAIAEYRAAIRLENDYAEAYCSLGHTLQRKGEFRVALEALRQGHALGSRDPNWPYRSEQWVRECERLVELEGRLPGLLAGQTTPVSAVERIELARLCAVKRLHRAAVRFYEEAFAEQPRLADHLGASHRHNAACAASLAGCGQGQDAGTLEDEERARLRRLALDWLRADLEAWGRLLDKEPDKVRPLMIRYLQHLLADPDCAGVRGPAALAKLPEAERQPWQRLWDDVADTLARAQREISPEQKANAK
jgi:serine/threonine protein kinase/Flp pilus assembly protein TadD